MSLYVYEYTGEFCSGGYVVLAGSLQRSQELFAESRKTHDKRNSESIINEFFKDQNGGYLRLSYVLPCEHHPGVADEEIILNSFDMF
jgi:hypothetical protein